MDPMHDFEHLIKRIRDLVEFFAARSVPADSASPQTTFESLDHRLGYAVSKAEMLVDGSGKAALGVKP